jgi:serpin B
MKKLLLTSIGLFVFMSIFLANYAIAQEKIPSPLMQIRMGVEPHNVQCNDGLQLIIRPSNNIPACVKPTTAEILSQRLLAIIVESSPTPPVSEPQPITDTPQTSHDAQNIVDANNKFMLDFYSTTSKPEDNSFFSPWSMLSAFSVLYEGARGQTADEIASVFYLPKDDSLRRTLFESLQDNLNVNGSGYELRNANALWIQQGFGIKEEFVNTARQYYDSEASEVSFPKDEPVIDSWVEQKTNDKIKNLVKGKTSVDTRLVITNAIYFKGTWQTQFESSQTHDNEFRVDAAKTVQVPMMQIQSKFAYAETDDLQVLSMPYKGQRMSMLVLLPKNDIGSLEKSINIENLQDWKTNLEEQKVMLFIPKFKLETTYGLSESMMDLGMKKAFDGDADLSGISDEKPLFVGFAIHKAFVDVNEEGTEAAAATAIGVMTESISPPIPIFKADHPFIFLIQDDETGLILFMGKVVDPTK